MSYRETLDYLFSQLPMFHRIGAAAYKADLTNTIALCDLLGNPQNNFPSVHIAGTNGKGSVSHFLASILQEAGLKVGLFTSPHLKDFRERIRVNGKMIPKKEVTNFIQTYKHDFEKIQLSFFEMTAGLAFHYFSTQKVDIAVIEVGLGGRLDSTNVVLSKISVITNISFDHIQFLGDSLEKIALEKAGIIKPKVPIVIGETQPAIKQVFMDKANESGSEIWFADAIYSIGSRLSAINAGSVFHSEECHYEALSDETTVSGTRLSGKALYKKLVLNILKNGQPFMSEVISPLSGNYQEKNIITVFAVCEMLNKQGFSITGDEIKKGIRNVVRNTNLKGRWQVLSRDPLTICDTGHNEGGLKEILSQISKTQFDHLHFVFGVVNDKEIDPIMTMLPKDATYYFCKANIPRGLDADELKTKAQISGLTGLSYLSVTDALNAAKANASCDDLIFIGGSTFVVAEVV